MSYVLPSKTVSRSYPPHPRAPYTDNLQLFAGFAQSIEEACAGMLKQALLFLPAFLLIAFPE
jgi:hypothetical protein